MHLALLAQYENYIVCPAFRIDSAVFINTVGRLSCPGESRDAGCKGDWPGFDSKHVFIQRLDVSAHRGLGRTGVCGGQFGLWRVLLFKR